MGAAVGFRNGELFLKCDNPIVGLALKAQLEKIIGNRKISITTIRAAIEGVSDREMKARLAKGTIGDLKRYKR